MKTGNIGTSELPDIGIGDVGVYDSNKFNLFEKMKKKGVKEIYYIHTIKNTGTKSNIILHYQIKDNLLFKEVIKSRMSFSLNEIPIYDELIKRCDVKVQSDNLGHIIYRTNSSWKTFSSKKFASLPNDYQYYRNNNRPNELDDMLVSIELDQLNTENKDKVDFHSLCQSIQIQLQKSFYNDVKTTVYICQLDKSGKKIREDYLRSDYKTKGFDIKLNITINYKGEVEIGHVASDDYMQAYVNKWQKEAKARGLDIDVEELRKRCIQDFESKATEQSFYTRFIQNIKSHFNENIAGYIEGIQATQKIAKNVWAEGTVNQSTWLTKDDEHKKWPKYVQFHPLVGGVTDGAIDEIAGIPLAVKGVYEIATDEEKQQALLKMFTKEGAKQMLEGLANDAKETLKDKDKTWHFGGQTAVSVASMISGAGFFSKGKKIDEVLETVDDLSKPFTNHKTFQAIEEIKEVNKYVPEESNNIKKFLKETDAEILDDLGEDLSKTLHKGEDAKILQNARKLPGLASGSGKEIKGKWLKGKEGNAGLFPKSVAEKLKGKNFNNFDEFRKEFWKSVADDPNLANQFIPQNISKMKQGLAPNVRKAQEIGGQRSYILHHKTPINAGGGVYDMDNLYIVTPKFHKEILSPSYHYGYGY